jgi:chromosome segregation ATPase
MLGAMEELHAANGPLSNTDLDERAVVSEERIEQPHREYLEHRDYYAEAAGELPEELPKGIVQRLEDLQRRLGRCEGRLELSQASEALLRKQLRRESERADRLEAELRDAEAELRAAEVGLAKARRGWFSRFFGTG